MYAKFLMQCIGVLLAVTAQVCAQPAGEGTLLSPSERDQLRTFGDEIIKRDPVVAIRLSTTFLNELISQPFVLASPISASFAGAQVCGNATFRGQNELCFEALRNNRPLTVLLKGEIRTSTSASKGPAIVRICGTTVISGRFQLDFDGKRFSYTPITVEACTSSRLDSVCAKAKLVRRIARRRAEKARPVANHTASQRAKQRIENEGNQALEKVVAELNKSIRFDATLESVLAGMPEPAARLSTTESYLQALVTTASEITVLPPGRKMLSDAVAEIWIRIEPDSPVVEEVEELWEAAQPGIAQLLDGFDDVQHRVQEIVTKRRVGDWVVIEIAGMEA